MKRLHFSVLLCATLLFFSCKKENTSSPQTDGSAKDHVRLPTGGEYVTLRFGNGKSMLLYKIDTNYIMEFDMVLVPAQIEALKAYNSPGARTYNNDVVKHWPSGRIPYVFNGSLTGSSQTTILGAISDWEAACAGVDFFPRTSETNYVEFTVASGPSQSPVGMIGGRQYIELVQGSGNVDPSSALHEMGHALGMYHEQSRTDRDNFININWTNIKPGVELNFQTYTQSGWPGTQFGAFDFNSIMLYESLITDPNFVFNIWISTLTTVGGGTWGRNTTLSAGDAETAQRIYGPPFVKLRYVQTYYYSQYGLYDEWEVEDGGFNAEFFSDAACTIPFTLTEAKTITYYTYGGYNNQTLILQSTTAPAGVSVYSIPAYFHREFRSEYGNTTTNIVTGGASPGLDAFWRGWL